MPAPLLAWQFELGPDHDDGVQIVYAASEARAMIYAGRQSGGGKGDRSPVTRAPKFDQYATAAGANPTTENFWDEGYWVTCWECEHRITGDDTCCQCLDNLVDGEPDESGEPSGETGITDDAAEELLGSPVAHNGHVYCSARCLARFTERCARVALRKEEAVAGLLARFPFVQPLGSWVGGAGACQGRPEDGFHKPQTRHGSPQKKSCFCVDNENITVRFKLPGGELSEKTSDGNAFHNLYCHRCGNAWIARGDYEAFECLATKPDAVVSAPQRSES